MNLPRFTHTFDFEIKVEILSHILLIYGIMRQHHSYVYWYYAPTQLIIYLSPLTFKFWCCQLFSKVLYLFLWIHISAIHSLLWGNIIISGIMRQYYNLLLSGIMHQPHTNKYNYWCLQAQS